MPLIKDGQISQDNWRHLADTDSLPAAGSITVGLKRWQDEREALAQYGAPVGVRLLAEDSVEALGAYMAVLPLIVLDMRQFVDGRSFSQARWIRDRLAYRGELRARGDFLLDQVFYLKRVGVNAFEFENITQAEHALPRLNEFSVRYQASSDTSQPLYRYRNA
ncbi:MAG: DUF934 domain-containing protein [Methylococcaceae bacterium]